MTNFINITKLLSKYYNLAGSDTDAGTTPSIVSDFS